MNLVESVGLFFHDKISTKMCVTYYGSNCQRPTDYQNTFNFEKSLSKVFLYQITIITTL
jgi:hypothetical protein